MTNQHSTASSSPAMSTYERQRWDELQAIWAKKAERRKVLPAPAKKALSSATDRTKRAAVRTGQAVANATPTMVKDFAGVTLDTALVPTAEGLVRVLELANEWVVELSDPERVLKHHRKAGRPVASIEDLRSLDLEVLDEVTRRMALRWRTVGAGEGAALGALAMIPVPVVASAGAITADLLVMQALTGAVAARACYAYGFDARDPDMKHMIDKMVTRSYRNQAAKARTTRSAGAAFRASKDRLNWSKKLREDHRLMAAMEKLLKQVGDGSRVPVKNARMGMPLVSIFVGMGTNSYVLGDTAKHAQNYAATMLLARKHDLPLPANLVHDADLDDTQGAGDDSEFTV
ncbi:EcsC family protein [Nostocoides vanveenii]